MRDGTTFTAPLPNDLPSVTDDVYGRRVYSPPGFEVRAGYVVVDIGANIGAFSIYAAKHAAQVHAVEPTPENAAALRGNVDRAGLSNVTTHEVAIADQEGTVRLYLTGTNGSNLLFDHGIEGKYAEYVEVPSTTLRAFLDEQEIATVDLLKIDCEGAEGLLLPTAPLDRVRRIALEYHDNVSPLDHTEIAELLKAAGFDVTVTNSTPFGYVYATRR